jgi:5'-nucleotidase
VRKLLAQGWPATIMLNVNFPDCAPDEVAGTMITAQGKRDQDYLRIVDRMDARGRPYFWLGFKNQSSEPAEGTDLWALREKKISVTPLSLNLTHAETCRKLMQAFGG